MRTTCCCVAFAATLAAQTQAPTAVPDYTFPTFANGDGRQSLADFEGHPILVVTFADVWGGLAASDPAIKLHESHEDEGLIVILTHTASGGTFKDGATDIDLGAWLMRRYPGHDVRITSMIEPTWRWNGAMSPFWAVIGPDRVLVGSGDTQKGARAMEDAVAAALKQRVRGFGNAEEAPMRALLHGKGALSQARGKASPSSTGEVDAAFARQTAAIEWLLADGQWQRAKAAFGRLEAVTRGVPEWSASIAALTERFGSADARTQLEVDGKLARLLDPLAKGQLDKGLQKRLADFAAKNDASDAGKRAARLAVLVEQAIGLK